jgi:hypothetical protein
MRNSDGITTNPAWAESFTWRVDIGKYRTAAVKNHNFIVKYSQPGGAFTSSTVQDHSPLMSGTFTITLDGIPIQIYNSVDGKYTISDIPYNVEPSVLKQGFRQIIGFENVEVERTGDTGVGAKWIIYYIGYNKNLPDLVLSAAKLLGGKVGTTPSAIAATRRDFNTNFFVDPMDYRWMRTYSNKPNVRVMVNDIPSACNTDCTYTFVNNVPIVTAASISGYTLSLTLSDPGTLNAPLTDIQVVLDNQPCTNLIGTMARFTCDLPTNSDNSPILTAGTYFPTVVVSPVGIISIDPTVNPFVINLAVTSVTNSSGGLNGGY